ncbi:MAG: hypothetical protein SFX72_01940 [Isosphaeraceae bacterium]|nr:hypothetical protein [Isosphaeraceae bacterium]
MIGFGLDGSDTPRRLTTSEQCLMIGGSEDTHDEMVETVLRLESELERRGRRLGDVTPTELADIAWRIDSPELHAIAVRLHDGLLLGGIDFMEASAEDLRRILD